MKHFQVYSEYDGWHIQLVEDSKVVKTWSWDHDDSELGVGGEKLFSEILKFLGHSVYEEEVY